MAVPTADPSYGYSGLRNIESIQSLLNERRDAAPPGIADIYDAIVAVTVVLQGEIERTLTAQEWPAERAYRQRQRTGTNADLSAGSALIKTIDAYGHDPRSLR